MDTVQTYEHDGGLFSFSVPAHWSHQTEDDGTQVLWDENAGSGTLRVTSLTAQREADPSSIPQLNLLSKEVPPSIREDGVAWVKYRREDTEDGRAHHHILVGICTLRSAPLWANGLLLFHHLRK